MDHSLHEICRKYRKTRRKPKGLKRLWAHLLNTPHIALIITAVVFVVVVVMWSLLWVFVCKCTTYPNMQLVQPHRKPPFPPPRRQSAGRATAEPILLGCSEWRTWSSSPSTDRRSRRSLCPWPTRSSMWYGSDCNSPITQSFFQQFISLTCE